MQNRTVALLIGNYAVVEAAVSEVTMCLRGIVAVVTFGCILLSGCSLFNSNQKNSNPSLTFEQRQQELIDKFGPPPPKGYQPIDPIPAQLCKVIGEANKAIGEANKNKNELAETAKKLPPPLLDILDVDISNIQRCSKISRAKSSSVLQSLPSEAVRLAIGQVDKSGNIAFGPFAAKRKMGSYVVVLDYIKYQSNTLPVVVMDVVPTFTYTAEDYEQYISINKQIEETNKKIKDQYPSAQSYESVYGEVHRLEGTIQSLYNKYLQIFLDSKPKWARNYNLHIVQDTQGNMGQYTAPVYYENDIQTNFNVPVYIGVGVRMIASVTVNSEEVDLGSLYGLAAGAQSGQLQGTLVFQTLGLSGESISPMLPMPSEINVTTIQNATQALATIKSKLYDGKDDGKVSVVPVVLGIDDYVGRAGSKEKIISKLQSESKALSLYVVED